MLYTWYFMPVLIFNTLSPFQIYTGSSHTTVIQNRDMVKELQVGMLVATHGVAFPRIGMVQAIPPNATETSQLSIQWMEHERAPHMPRWLRFFKPSAVVGTVFFADIVLYDFMLTKVVL